jgi:BlaI family penicillinase repressor
MRTLPRISQAEWEVMEVLWKKSPRTASEVVEVLSGKGRWKRETIRTLINRLVRKKAVGFEKKGKQYHYFPFVKEAECIRKETKTFLRRFHGGSIEPMLAAFVEEKHLSAEQITRLRQILDGKYPAAKPRKSKKHTP